MSGYWAGETCIFLTYLKYGYNQAYTVVCMAFKKIIYIATAPFKHTRDGPRDLEK